MSLLSVLWLALFVVLLLLVLCLHRLVAANAEMTAQAELVLSLLAEQRRLVREWLEVQR